MKPQNIPGEPIITRHKSARFYCIACFKTYWKCQCRVYMSADTLPLSRQGKQDQNAKSPMPRHGIEAL